MEEGVALIAQVALCFMVECEKELLLFSDSLLGMMLSLCVINKKEERDAALLVSTGTEWDD